MKISTEVYGRRYQFSQTAPLPRSAALTTYHTLPPSKTMETQKVHPKAWLQGLMRSILRVELDQLSQFASRLKAIVARHTLPRGLNSRKLQDTIALVWLVIKLVVPSVCVISALIFFKGIVETAALFLLVLTLISALIGPELLLRAVWNYYRPTIAFGVSDRRQRGKVSDV
jgi:hypothetical protein